MNAAITSLLVFALIAAVWQYIPAPQPLKVIGWIIIGVAFILKFLLPLLK